VAWLFVLAFGGLAVAQASWARSQRRDLGELLAARAGAVGGRAIDEATIEVARGGTVVRVELIDLGPGVWGAHAIASRRLPLPGRVTAGRRSFRGLTGVAVHGAMLYADDPELARRMWSAEATVAWRRLPQAALVVDGLTVACTAREATPTVIATLIDLVARLADWDDGLGALLTGLAGAEPLAAPAIGVALAPDGLEVRVELADDGPRLVASLAAAATTGELPGAVREHLARAGLAGLRTDDGVAVVTWLDVEREPARIRAGVAALRALAARYPDGPYRS
jgi:hypothetical protein